MTLAQVMEIDSADVASVLHLSDPTFGEVGVTIILGGVVEVR